MQPGIYFRYGKMTEIGLAPFPPLCGPIKITGTTASSKNASISMNKSSTADPSKFDIVYESGGNSITDVHLWCSYNGTWQTYQNFYFISYGCGYLNYKPTVVQLPNYYNSRNIRVCWIRDLYGGGSGFPHNVNAVYYDPTSNPPVYTYSGNMVNSVSVNVLNDNSNTYYAYAQNTNNNNWQNFARSGSNTINLNTTGRHIQLSNGSSSANMFASSFYPVSLPYYFLTSNSLGGLSKSSSEENTFGRGMQLLKDSIVFSYSMKSLTADKSTIKFVEIPERKDTSSAKGMVQPLTIDSLNIFLLSEPFTIQNGTMLNFSEGAGFNSISGNYKVNCTIELIEEGTSKQIGVIKQVQFTPMDKNKSDLTRSNVKISDINKRTVRLKITLTTNIADVKGVLVNEYNTVNDGILSKLAVEELKLEEEGLITTYAMDQNYPNPFNPSTIIKYQIPKDGFVSLKIYDILGKEIKTLVNEQKAIGRYEVKFDASDLASGVYICQIRANDFVSSKKMLLVK